MNKTQTAVPAVEPRTCLTCGLPAQYCGYSSEGVSFTCDAGHVSWYYDSDATVLTAAEWDTGVLAIVGTWMRGELSPQGLIQALGFLGRRPAI